MTLGNSLALSGLVVIFQLRVRLVYRGRRAVSKALDRRGPGSAEVWKTELHISLQLIRGGLTQGRTYSFLVDGGKAIETKINPEKRGTPDWREGEDHGRSI